MLNTLTKAYNIFQQQGPVALFKSISKHIYMRLIRPRLPCRDYQEIQGVTIYSSKRCEKILDSLFNVDTSWPQSHKMPNCEFIKKYVTEGDSVVIIGGGYGISSTTAARKVGHSGKVIIYEGADEVVKELTHTLDLNDVIDQTCVKHAIVGDVANLKSPGTGAEALHPSSLPPCDVIEMDCEGAEISLIPKLPTDVNTIIVETHPSKEAPTSDVRKILKNQGWQVIQSTPDRSSGDVLVATK